MNFIVIDNGSSYLDELKLLLVEHSFDVLDFASINASVIRDSDTIILTGGHTYPVAWHDDDYRQEINLIKHHGGPIIGICLGLQLIAHVYGSHMHLLEKRRKGIVTLEPVAPNDLVKTGETVRVYESHRWSVEKVKQPLVALARSSDGIEILKHISRPIYGLQFHPEVSKQTSGTKIFERVIDEIKE